MAIDSDHDAEEFVGQQAAVHSDVKEALQQEITQSEIKGLKMTQVRSIASHFSIKVKGRKKEEYSDAIIAFLDKCSCKQ